MMILLNFQTALKIQNDGQKSPRLLTDEFHSLGMIALVQSQIHYRTNLQTLLEPHDGGVSLSNDSSGGGPASY
jgi:hypothetical protein